jgi:hypothetical protein
MVLVLAQPKDNQAQEKYLINGIPQQIQEVIRSNDDLFETPQNLPPSRTFDHVISLIPASVPMNCSHIDILLNKKMR